jgi:6-pyruvoyltetrahydropterin 2'-reductase
MKSNSHKYTELFRSFQGEGTHTGKNTLWLRWFLCNLECRGFGQEDPTNPETYKEVGNDRNLIDIKNLNELPIFEYGCDSAYSVAKKYEHLVYDHTAEEIADRLEAELVSPTNPQGLFKHPRSGAETHMCFTGGEPMMRQSQRAIESVMRELHSRGNMPKYVTIETNGTQKLSKEFVEFLEEFHIGLGGIEWFWSLSPKLFNTSGETARKAIKPDVIKSYQDQWTSGHLKFVVNGTEATWQELEDTVDLFRQEGISFPVWIMPVGATKEDQETEQVKKIVSETLERGYNVSGRLHAHMLGNELNT